jgi:hypothetical protein
LNLNDYYQHAIGSSRLMVLYARYALAKDAQSSEPPSPHDSFDRFRTLRFRIHISKEDRNARSTERP